jgi:hypothetical protein
MLDKDLGGSRGAGLLSCCGFSFSTFNAFGTFDTFTRDNILLARAVNGDLDGNFAAFNLLAIHVLDSLLLKGLGAQSDESKATALAGFVAGLELLDHEARNGAQGNLSRNRLVFLEKFLELYKG